MNSGWISFHRQVLNNPVVCKDSDYMAVWVYLLLNATHCVIKKEFNGKIIELKPGQLITGREAISAKFSISSSKVQRILKRYESEQQIEQQTTNRNRLITVLNWDQYQQSEQQIEQPVNNYRTTSEQPVNTNNNINNINNKIKESKDSYSSSKKERSYKIVFDYESEKFVGIEDSQIEKWKEAFPACDIEIEIKRMEIWAGANPTKKKKDWKRFIGTWLSNNQERGGTRGVKPQTKDLDEEYDKMELKKQRAIAARMVRNES